MALDQLITGRYQRGRLLGSGGMGAVYLAEDVRLRREVAIKMCSTRGLPPAEAQAAADLFQSEALTLARLRHPGLTAVWDYFNEGEDWYLVMEYVPGITLRELLAQQGARLPQQTVSSYAGQLCDVLNYLHTRTPPVVFRDLKPSNIMVMPDDTLKLIDFGIARLFSPGKHADTAQFGTPGYAPPEQYGGQTEPRSDIYSLGVVVHQMLTGYNPTGAAFMVPPASAIDPSITPAVEDVLRKATAPEPADRFPSVADFCVALRLALKPGPALQSQPLVVHVGATIPSNNDAVSRRLWAPVPRGLPTRPEQSSWGRSLLITLLLVLLLGSAGGGAWLLRSHFADILPTTQSVPSHPVEPTVAISGTLVYVAPGPQHRDAVWLRQDGSQSRLLTEVDPGQEAALPALSPDKSRIAYTLVTKTGTQQLLLLDVGSGKQRQLLADRGDARAASWSPDGRQLAVEVAAEGKRASIDHDIVLLDPDTGHTEDLVTTPSWEGGPAWSPDGKRIAYHALYSGCMTIWVVELQHRDQARRLTDPATTGNCTSLNNPDGDFWPSWSPDGTRLAFGHKQDSPTRLAILDFRDNRIKSFRTSGDAQGNGEKPVSHPRWSPQGNAIIFDEGSVENGDVVLSQLNLQSNEITTLPNSTRAHFADWRP